MVWIEIQMTGRDRVGAETMEIALTITDGSLQNKIEGPNIIIDCPKHWQKEI